MEKKKSNIILLGLLLITIMLTIGVSYALWQITLQQNSTNTITTSCFKIEFQDDSPIHLSNAYPINDEEGKSLVPYEFTITNTCDSYASFQINLEILNDTTLNRLEYIKITLNEKAPSILTSFQEVEKTLYNATRSYKLETGFLDPNEIKEFELRLWLDEDTPAISDVMEKTLMSKITITTSFLPKEPTYSERIVACSNSGHKTVDCMKEYASYDTVNLAYDETLDNNLRYIGADPNNYVLFNDELWRIIGIMESVEDEKGKKDSRIRLVRDESIGSYSWDTSSSGINGGYGVNEWSQADLMKLLNPGYEEEAIGGSLYWNRQSGRCYNERSNATTPCDFTNTGLREVSKAMILPVVWHLGSNGSVASINNILTSEFYVFERSSNSGKVCSGGEGCNDNVTRTTSLMANVGLIYPSDYGYATSGGTTTNRSVCLNTILYSWNSSNRSDCRNNNWLYKSNNQWTLFPPASSKYSNDGLHITNDGQVVTHALRNSMLVFPVVYLKSNTSIINGNGTQDSPYILETKE